jgi:pilus assembly protein CpaE
MAEKLLIVDDDVDTLRLVGLMLQRQGYQIVAANNGHQALIMAQSEEPDLILLDVMMPDMDGYEVTRRLRANISTNTIPIIMFTAKSQVDDKVSGYEVGADDYLTKPTQPRELFAHVKAVLARGSKTRPAEPAAEGDKGHVIGIVSAKGGLGATTLAMNLGIMLHLRTKKEVIVAEFRPGEGSMALDLGFTKPEGLNRLLQCDPTEISVPDVEKELLVHTSGVRFLMSSYSPHDARFIVSSDTFEAIAHKLSRMASYIVMDFGPGLPPATEKMISLCDDMIVVVDPSPYTVLRTKVLIDELTERGIGEGRMLITLINRIRTEMQISWTQVRDQLGHDLAVAFTPAPELIYQAAKNNQPAVTVQPDSLTTQQFTKLADTIIKHVHQEA